MESFYVFLPSNSPVEGNFTGNYTVRLPNTIDLSDGEWSVALSSIIYPISYQSDAKKEMWVEIDYYQKLKQSKKFNLPSNITFNSISHLQNTINDTIFPLVRMARAIDPVSEEVPIISEDDQKKIHSAKVEVRERSHDVVFGSTDEIEENIVEAEALTAKIEKMSYFISTKARPQADFTEEEARDIEVYKTEKYNAATIIRDESQQQRSWLFQNQQEYQRIMDDLDKAEKENKVYEARQVADRAKKIAQGVKAIQELVNSNRARLQRIFDEVALKNEEIDELIRPIDVSMKNNVKRIKQAILAGMNASQKENLEIYIYYDENMARFFLYVHKPLDIKRIKISPRLAYILGFQIHQITNEVEKIRMRHGGGFAKYSPDISSGIHQLYVYAPGLIESSFVGNVQAPLLRIVNVSAPSNTVAESIYTNTYFMKVIEKRISSIKITIKDAFNEVLKFNWGNVIVTLAFRKNFNF